MATRIQTPNKEPALPQRLMILVLKCYRYLISPLIGNNCRFYPSCSSYMETAVARFGVIKGFWMGLRRLSKCHPWHEGGVDPVPFRQNHQHPQTATDSSWKHNV